MQSAGPNTGRGAWLNDVPGRGDRLYVTEDDKLSRLVAQERKGQDKGKTDKKAQQGIAGRSVQSDTGQLGQGTEPYCQGRCSGAA